MSICVNMLYVALGSPKTKLCPLVQSVGNSLYGSSSKFDVEADSLVPIFPNREAFVNNDEALADNELIQEIHGRSWKLSKVVMICHAW